MSTRKPLKEISISELTTGMFVVKMDISWLDNPFFSPSRRIKTEKDIAMLQKAGAKRITIDPNKGPDIEETDDSSPTPQLNTPVNKAPNSAKPGEQLEKELDLAIHLRSKAKKAISQLQQDIGSGKPIKTEQVTPLLEQTLESLERNDQALMNLAHLSRRSQKIGDHTFATFCIALNLAQQTHHCAEEIQALGIAALLHETGWAQIPLSLMGKRKAYTPTEVGLIQKHPELGLKMLTSSEIPELSRRIIAEHHELADGSGYPNGLNAEQTHPLSQLFSVVDRYDELVHQLNDRPGMLPTNALRTLYMSAEKGVYSEIQVGQLIALLGVYPVSSSVKLNNGIKGIVREVPSDDHLHPLVEIFYDSNNQPVSTPFFIDLREPYEGQALDIVSVIDPKNSIDDPHKKLHFEYAK